jgi:hypothetical protein
MSEFIYILENPSFDGVVKIGRTARDVAERVKELSSHTGVPTEFTVFRKFTVEDATIAERKIHERLAEYRVSENREFFRLSADEAALVLEEMLGSDSKQIPDRDREDDLLFAATQIAISQGQIWWPSTLAGPLNISYDEAERLIQSLQGRGIINSNNELCADLQPVRRKMLQEESKKQQMEKAAAFARAEEQYKQIQQVKELLDGLADPETGEPVEIYFDNDDGNLAINIRGTEWVRSEAQRLLSTLS